ncbi:hypothetical protein Cgig2_007169 [Carnegiea gigantea]|uniref:Uncharacterized protein n=1 Tax=Carnegiea gigantea TaxID=171969 RepID=A0A9Q1JSH6_9CARY|nr:hypothetical protein Cgig2_007169 [Carnegiea gigantea]
MSGGRHSWITFVSKVIPSLSLSLFGQVCGISGCFNILVGCGVPMRSINSFALIGMALSTFFTTLRSFSTATLQLKASKAFFLGFTNSIVSAPMVFFDSTTVGRIFTHAYIYIYVYITHLHTPTHTHIYMYIYTHTHICIHIYIYMYMYVCVYIYIYIYIYMYTYIYIYICMYVYY